MQLCGKSSFTGYALSDIAMTLHIIPHWKMGDFVLDARLLPLLRAVAKEGSLNRAVSARRLSYRHAWGLLQKIERALGRQLVVMERGRGARLSAFAESLIEADDAANGLLERELGATLAALNRKTATPPRRAAGPVLVVHASHDLALAELRDLLARSNDVALDLHFRGSLDCLAGLARSECDLAGFHLPESSAPAAALAPYRPLLATRGLRLIRFVHRRQGLIVPRGNPKRLLTLTDLAEKEARFVNRQPESGTRLCFDRLLAAERLQPVRIRGYQMEEFTHAAVAATVASGMADAGFGIEAAAHQHGLDFVPLADERYFLAARSEALTRAPLRAVLQALRDPAFRKWVNAQPGYQAAGIGEIIGTREALRPA